MLAISLILTAALSAQAMGATSTVTLVTTSGSRVFTAKTLTGDSLNALALGSGREAAFMVNVTDAAYDRKNYQVTAMMSDLYQFDSVVGTFNCGGTSIPASKASIGFVPNPTSVRDLAGAAEPQLKFEGTITSAALLASLGLSQPTAVSVRTKQNLQTFAKSGAYYGTESALPLQVSQSTGGAFTSAASHATCNPSASAPTSVKLQDGTVNSVAEVLAWIQAAATDLFNGLSGPDGFMSVAEAVSSGIITQETVNTDVRQALVSAPLNISPLLVTESAISQVGALISAAASEVTAIVRQSGSYSTLPKLMFGDLAGTPTGTYRGTLTLTMIDS